MPKTLSEKKDSACLISEIRLEDLPVRFRAKRKNNNLPDSWWDLCRRTQKNWKSYRKTQFKSII